MKTQEIKGENILLLGYGRENQSVHRFLLANYPEVTIGIADKNPIAQGPDFKQLGPGLSAPKDLTRNQHIGSDYLSHLANYDTVIRSPGIPCHTEELQDYSKKGGHVTSATNIFFSLCPGITIGVTGTKGKSTTSALIAHIMKTNRQDARLVGNIGNPTLDYLQEATTKTVFIIELSSHQLEDCRYSPNIAIVLNIFPEHMDYYQTFDQYVTAKTHIVAFQTEKDSVIYDDSNTTATAIAQTSKGQKISISQVETTPIPKSILIGNDINIRVSLAVASTLHVPEQLTSDAISTFQPLSHRLEFVGEYKKIKFYNDSLATIPEATIHAIESLGDDVTTLIAGGYDRGLDYTSLGKFLAQRKTLTTLILFPDTGSKIWEATLTADPSAQTRISKLETQTMANAISLSYRHTPSGKICLLSPGAASFNLFKDYVDRGEQFKSEIDRQGK